MNRYQMAVAKAKTGKAPAAEFGIEATDDLQKVKRAVYVAADEGQAFRGDNIEKGLLDRAVLAVSLETKIPIVVATSYEASILAIAYGRAVVWGRDAPRAKIGARAIMYGSFEYPPGVRAWATVKRGK